MRNLKRALSLALASVMLLGMMVVGTSAAYSDIDVYDNVEAIEVLKAVGIMVGDENGNFNPDNKVTRQEMAVVMANLMDYRVASYKGTAPFADVADWAEPYVAACYTNGITSGMGEGYYGAAEYVTTAQAALMLMKALGYFQFQSDFGSDWQLATVKQANKIELFDDVEAGVKDAMTRNELAQLVLNTLESGMVEADDDTIKVTTDNATVEAGSVNYSYVTSSKAYASTIGKVNTGSGTAEVSTAGYIVELGEKLYDGDLKKVSSSATDSYGRPAVRWDYKLDKIGDFAKEPIAVYTAKVTKAALYDLIGKDRIDDVSDATATAGPDFTFVINGSDTTYYGSAFDAVKANFFTKNSSAAAEVKDNQDVTVYKADNGVVTEVYLDAKTGDIDIVAYNTYVMKAANNYDESNETLDVAVKTGSATASKLDAEDFAIADYKKNDYILYTYIDGAIEDIFPATKVQGVVEAYTVGKNVTLDGTKYSYNYTAKQTDKDNEYRVTDTASVVLDQYGYIVLIDDASVSLGNYLYIASAAQKSGLATDFIAKAYFTDGTKATITLDDYYAVENATSTTKLGGILTDTTASDRLNGWYSYSVNADGEYTIRAVKSGAGLESSDDVIVAEKVAFTGGMVGNDKTVLIVDDGDEISVYTGIKNFPDVKAAAAGKEANVVVGLKEKADPSKTYASVVIAITDGDNVDSKANDALVYVLNADSTYVDTVKNEKITVWNAIVEGVKTKIEAKANKVTQYTLYYQMKQDTDNYYEGVKTYAEKAAASATDKYVTTGVNNEALSYSNGSLKIGSATMTVGEDTKINVVVKCAGLQTDPAAKYELFLGTTADVVAAKLDKYLLTGSVAVIYADDIADTDVATEIVLTVEGFAAKPVK